MIYTKWQTLSVSLLGGQNAAIEYRFGTPNGTEGLPIYPLDSTSQSVIEIRVARGSDVSNIGFVRIQTRFGSEMKEVLRVPMILYVERIRMDENFLVATDGTTFQTNNSFFVTLAPPGVAPVMREHSAFLTSGFYPTVTLSATPYLVNAGTATGYTGIFFKGLHRAALNATATDTSGYGIKDYTFSGSFTPTHTVLTASTWSDALMAEGPATFNCTVRNNLGLATTASVTINVANYAYPTVMVGAQRCDENGNEDDGGDYVTVTVSGTVFALDSGITANTLRRISVSVPGTSTQWSGARPAGDYTEEIGPMSVGTGAKTITVTVIDNVLQSLGQSAVTTTYKLQSAAVIVDFLAGGKGIALGTNITDAMLSDIGASSLFYSAMSDNAFRGNVLAGFALAGSFTPSAKLIPGPTSGLLELLDGNGNKAQQRIDSTNAINAIDSYDSNGDKIGGLTFPRNENIDLAYRYFLRSAIPDGADANDITDAGIYYKLLANTVLNLPPGVSYGHLEVLKHLPDSSIIVQRFTEATRCFFRRTGNGGTTWTDWVEIATDQNAFMTAQIEPTDMNDTSLLGATTLLNAASVSNLPTTSGYYRAICLPYYQLAARYSSTGSPLLYQRIYTNGKWYPWAAINDTNIQLESTTAYGLDVSARKNGKVVVVRVSGTASEELATNAGYVDLMTLPEGMRPPMQMVSREWVTITLNGAFQVNANGTIRLGYTGYPNGSGGRIAASVPSGSSIYLTMTYITAS